MSRFIFPHLNRSGKSRPGDQPGWTQGLASLPPLNLRLFFLAVFLVIIAYISWQAWPSFFDMDEKNTTVGSDYLPYRLKQGDVLVQDFKSVKNGLVALTLSFDLPENADLPDETQIRISVQAEGEQVAAEQALLNSNTLKLFARTRIPLQFGSRTAGRAYRVILSIDKLPESARLSIHTSHASQSSLLVNGRETGLAAVMSLTYSQFNAWAFIRSLVLMLLILVLVILPLPRIQALLQEAIVIPLLAAPFLTLASIEILNTLNQDALLSVPVFWLTYLTILLFELLLASLLGRIRMAILANHLLFIALGAANHIKLFFRGDPFVAGDLRSVTEAAHTINHLNFIINSRFLAAALLLAIFFLLMGKTRDTHASRRTRWITSALTLVPLVALLNGLVLNPALISQYPGITRFPWNQMVNYNQNGVVIPFLQSTRNLNISQPEQDFQPQPGFYEIPAGQKTSQASPDKPNIIAIMSESFADFDNIRPVETTEPVMPFFDQLLNSPNARHGKLLVSIFGGGTCNSEFEFLTGSSMLFMADGSLPYNSYFMGPTHALPDLLGQQGYRSVAIHPYLRTFWDRNLVYPAIGFDQYISMEDFPADGKVRDFISDEADFNQIIRTYENKQPEERLFIFSVTMQNHFPYNSSEEILSGLDYNIKLPTLTEVESVELYLSLLRQSDDALRDLIYYFSTVDEPTLIVLFGDHLPGNNNVFKNFYEDLFGKPLADLTQLETQKIYETPWLIWANYELPAVAKDVTSPNFLATTVLDLAGAEKSPYFEQVSQLNQTVKAMNNKMVITRDGRTYDKESLPSSLVRQLNRYWALEYDNVVRDKAQ